MQTTPTGQIVRSTDTVELDGDIQGRILYHPVSVFDFIAGTLVNTGNQVFSGTVLDSDPVLLHDDEFRFEVDLTTGETRGWVYLENHLAGEKIRCELEITGPTGMTAASDPMVVYTGQCRIRTPLNTKKYETAGRCRPFSRLRIHCRDQSVRGIGGDIHEPGSTWR
jgi:hypothetical protein